MQKLDTHMVHAKDENFYEEQFNKRQQYLDAILDSKHPKKLIIAGPGTGKTYTFSEVIKRAPDKSNLAITFIRKLVSDMEKKFGDV